MGNVSLTQFLGTNNGVYCAVFRGTFKSQVDGLPTHCPSAEFGYQTLLNRNV